MNLLSFRYFLEIARYLNYSKASESLHISQPALSQQINALEKEIGFRLFNRTTRKVALTEEGGYLYKKLSPLFEIIENTIDEVVNTKAIPQTVVKIASIPSAASIYLPKLLISLHNDLPDVQFDLQETRSVQAMKLLKQQKIHLAFIRTPTDLNSLKSHGFNLIEFRKHPIQLIVSNNHAVAFKESIDLYELRNEKFIHYDQKQSPALHFLLERACLNAGFIPETLCSGAEILTISNLIANGLGVTLMPKDMIGLLDSDKISAVNLKNQQFQSSISVIWQDSDYIPLVSQIILQFLKRIESSVETDRQTSYPITL